MVWRFARLTDGISLDKTAMSSPASPRHSLAWSHGPRRKSYATSRRSVPIFTSSEKSLFESRTPDFEVLLGFLFTCNSNRHEVASSLRVFPEVSAVLRSKKGLRISAEFPLILIAK